MLTDHPENAFDGFHGAGPTPPLAALHRLAKPGARLTWRFPGRAEVRAPADGSWAVSRITLVLPRGARRLRPVRETIVHLRALRPADVGAMPENPAPQTTECDLDWHGRLGPVD